LTGRGDRGGWLRRHVGAQPGRRDPLPVQRRHCDAATTRLRLCRDVPRLAADRRDGRRRRNGESAQSGGVWTLAPRAASTPGQPDLLRRRPAQQAAASPPDDHGRFARRSTHPVNSGGVEGLKSWQGTGS